MRDGAAGSIWFRALSSGDAALVHDLHGDPMTNAHNPLGASPDLLASERMLENWLQHRMDHGFGYELAFEGNRLAGICGARRDLWLNMPVINLYWRLLPDFWGKGLAADLGRHALDIARSATPLVDELTVARMLPGNAVSVRVAEKLGLTRRSDLDGEAHGAHWILYADSGLVP
ncbi:GNAT family N-acetyltransferase [Microbacterium sp. A93]|uniref:GNAT family N-acetyltransferase n=1 Tax=Microbacterium sp. A93 TaxID=3450716 RepID=UPI003F429B64